MADNANVGIGLLAAPPVSEGVGLLGLDPRIVQRGLLLPLGRTADNELEFALPQLAVDFLRSAMLPGQVLQGHQATPAETTEFALNTLMLGGPAGAATVPSGSLGSLSGPAFKLLYDLAQLNRNPKKAASHLVREGSIAEADRRAAADAVAEMRAKRDARFQMRSRDPLEIAAATRPHRAEAMRNINRVMNVPIAEAWSKTFKDKIRSMASHHDIFASEIEREGRRATLEAITREARKRGWKTRHTSTGQSGRVSSRYIDVPGKGEVRVSDHELPETPQRQHNRAEGRAGRWVDEVIVDDWRAMSLDDFLERIAE